MNRNSVLSAISPQLISLLNQLDNQAYCQKLAVLSNASIGQHFRHILDFYNCLLVGIKKNQINYASRERNPRIETDISYTIRKFEDIQEKIANLDVSKSVEIYVTDSEEETEEQIVNSSIGRELMYAFDHAIHHLAIIKIALQSHFPQIKIDQSLGVAPSTLKYRAEQKAIQVSSS